MTRLNNNKIISVQIISLLILLCSGCSTRIGDLTFVSTKNIDLTDTRLDIKTGQRFKGEDCRLTLLGIPFGYPNLKEAIDEALEKGNGNVMVDEVTYLKSTWVVLGHISCYEVEGTVLKTSSSPPANN